MVFLNHGTILSFHLIAFRVCELAKGCEKITNDNISVRMNAALIFCEELNCAFVVISDRQTTML